LNTEIFREYDIRGTYPETINESIAYTIGRSYGSYLQEKYNQTTCVVAHDNRLSSDALSSNLIKGITESGCNVIDYGLATTPMNYYGRYLNHLFGIMVTASHNPKDDNGFKFSFDHLANARGPQIYDFRDYTLKGIFKNGNGTITKNDITEKYLEYMKDGIKFGPRKRKVVIDCGNGVTCTVARKIFSQFNIDFEIINEESDGTFPNHHPDPAIAENMIQLQNKVKELHADLGIAYDGDGDRIGFVKEDGTLMSTEEFMIIIIRDIINKVQNKTFLYDVKCSKTLEDEIKKLGGTPLMYRTGASYTEAKCKEDNIPFGGELSGHLFFRDKVADIGSGIYASLRMCEILSRTNLSVSELCQGINKYYSTPEIKFPSPDDKKFNVIENIKKYCEEQKYPIVTIDGVKAYFQTGWILVRASNTGPNITFRAEATTEQDLEKLKNFFTNLINQYNK
jgi:phosphomannomutase/phosphoglucomutase